MADSDKAYQASADLNLWYKIRTGDEFVLADIPEIIPLRWTYFRDNWEFIKPNLVQNASNYTDPDFLYSQIKQFTDFIDKQRNSPTNSNPFSDSLTFYKYYAIFDSTTIESINLTNDESTIITNKVATVQAYSKNDFLRIKKDITAFRDSQADIAGLGDTRYDQSVGRSAVPAQRTATLVDANLLLSLQEDIGAVDFILANLFAVDSALDPFALARSNANNPDINIGQYSSGKLVKLNYGEDLSSLANRYLGSPDSWIDIAIANGLKPPYIDEVGQRLNLLSNGNGNQINIKATDANGAQNIEKFYINQVILLQSSSYPAPDQRTIININQIPVSGEIVITLSGDTDLSKYTIADGANIRVYLPNTINSSFYVLIPQTDPLPNNRTDELPWFLEGKAQDEKQTKVDLAIDENGEINFGTNGDLSLSYGLDNAIQAMRLKVITELGSLRYHPTFGLVNILGNKNNNINDLKNLLIDSLSSQVAADPRFARIETLNVQYLVPDQKATTAVAIGISMSVRLAGGSTVIPISFTIAK